ncbi:MAG TPA: hypothetical protein VF593_02965 [Chthoniobacteraceae bacterium]|jgi:hypothetical protein
MKNPALTLVLILALLSIRPALVISQETLVQAKNLAPATANKTWSVVGNWDCSHPGWKDTVSIHADGSFSRGSGDSGRWTLTGLDGGVVLLLAWDRWPAETATMVSADEFRGRARDSFRQGELRMLRTE